jgi:long-chain acyl-CoA synthetase
VKDTIIHADTLLRKLRRCHMPAPNPVLRPERHFGGRVVYCRVPRPRHAAALLDDAVARWPQAEALVDGTRRWNYRELKRDALRLAVGLHARGVLPGERVALFSDNRAEFVLALLACVRLGAPVVPLSARYRAPEVLYALEDSGAIALLVGPAQAAAVPQNLPATLRLRVDTGPGFDALGADSGATWADPLEDDPFAILYTSGTTGRPKGAVQTHLGIVHGSLQFVQAWGLRPGERSVLAVPATHAAGIGVIFSMLACGGCTVLTRAFHAPEFLAIAEAERMSYAALVPAMVALLLREPGLSRFDLSAWRVCGYGAAPMTPALIAELRAALPQLEPVNAYGSTETTQPPVLMPLGQTAAHSDSVGMLVPGAELVVVDEQGCEVPPGGSGELWFRGPTVIPGYWRNPQADCESFSDGWWHSGDIGSVDTQGYVRVFDRLKDMIVRGGYKVFSAEVEAVLAEHPLVLESAVVGRADPVLGERVHAVVVSRPGATVEALRGWCAERLADYKVPEGWSLQSDPLPRNPSGKVLKRELRLQLDAR